jgi:serine/threonine protein kinase
MAPELVSDPDHVSEKADVWSLGMVLWEMLALRTPFQHLSPQQIIAGAPPCTVMRNGCI